VRTAERGRRRFLRNAGVCLALPALESLLPRGARAQAPGVKRLVVLHHKNGTTQGADDVDPPADLLARFDELRPSMTVVKNLNNTGLKNAQSRTDYYTAHAAPFLVLYSGRTMSGVGDEHRTFDQDIAAGAAGEGTRLRTLAINCFQKTSGQNGVAPQTFNVLSWRGPGQPIEPYGDPRLLFERMFAERTAEPNPELEARMARRGLYLDAVLGEIRTLRRRLGATDQQNLDEYLTGVEELDRRTRALGDTAGELACNGERPATLDSLDLSRVQGETYAAVVDLMQELAIRALQCEETRVVTLMHAGIANGTQILNAVDRTGFEGSAFGWHPLSHWSAPYGTLSTDVNVNRRDLHRFLLWHYDRAARFVTRLRDTPGPAGVPLLDDTLVAFGSELSFGPGHSARRLYQLLFGGGPTFRRGAEIDAGGVPTSHLWSAIRRGFGVPGPVGESEGEVTGVLA
jgi:hypothetical protein